MKTNCVDIKCPVSFGSLHGRVASATRVTLVGTRERESQVHGAQTSSLTSPVGPQSLPPPPLRPLYTREQEERQRPRIMECSRDPHKKALPNRVKCYSLIMCRSHLLLASRRASVFSRLCKNNEKLLVIPFSKPNGYVFINNIIETPHSGQGQK